jgi:hypothetical protein
MDPAQARKDDLTSVSDNAEILAQLAILGTPQNRFDDFLLDPPRGLKLLNGLQAFDASQSGFRNQDIFAAVQGLCRISESLLAHVLEKYGNNERIKNRAATEKLLSLLRAGPVNDRKSLNRIIGTFYDDWPYAAHWRRDLYRIPQGGLTVMGLIYGGVQKLRDLMDEQSGLA